MLKVEDLHYLIDTNVSFEELDFLWLIVLQVRFCKTKQTFYESTDQSFQFFVGLLNITPSIWLMELIPFYFRSKDLTIFQWRRDILSSLH